MIRFGAIVQEWVASALWRVLFLLHIVHFHRCPVLICGAVVTAATVFSSRSSIFNTIVILTVVFFHLTVEETASVTVTQWMFNLGEFQNHKGCADLHIEEVDIISFTAEKNINKLLVTVRFQVKKSRK